MVGLPSTRDFERIVRGNIIKNLQITISDIRNANNVFGPDIGSLRGKTVWHTPDPVVSE